MYLYIYIFIYLFMYIYILLHRLHPILFRFLESNPGLAVLKICSQRIFLQQARRHRSSIANSIIPVSIVLQMKPGDLFSKIPIGSYWWNLLSPTGPEWESDCFEHMKRSSLLNASVPWNLMLQVKLQVASWKESLRVWGHDPSDDWGVDFSTHCIGGRVAPYKV